MGGGWVDSPGDEWWGDRPPPATYPPEVDWSPNEGRLLLSARGQILRRIYRPIGFRRSP